MLVTELEILRVIHENPKATFDFPLYAVDAELGINPTATMTRRTYLPAGSLIARTIDELGEIVARMPIDKLVISLWESLSQFSMNGEVIAKRFAYGQPMLSVKDELFTSQPIEEWVEDNIIAAATGREAMDLSEVGAASLMKSFAMWRNNQKS